MYRVHVRGLCLCADSYEAGVVFFWHTIIYFFGKYTYTFVMHMVYNILVVYDMQV